MSKTAHHRVRIMRHPTARAFTLIETLVAISVLLLSLVGPLSIASQALSAAYYARDQISAFYLAQEGAEYVRAIRDQNFLDNDSGTTWLSGLSSCINASCSVDMPYFTHQGCSGTCNPMLINNTSGLYTMSQTNAKPSIYTRTLRLETIEGRPDEILMRVTVTWQSVGINRSFQIKQLLFNWL